MYDLTGSLRLALGDPRWRNFYRRLSVRRRDLFFRLLPHVTLQPLARAALDDRQLLSRRERR
jgi:hypothetical protein